MDLHSQLDGRDRSQSHVSQNGGHTEVLRVHDVGYQCVELLFQHVHRYIGFHLLGSRLFLWHRQCTFVHLSILIQWDGLYLHGHGRHHIRRFLLDDELVHGFDVHLVIAHHVSSDKLTTTVLIKSLHGHILNTRELSDNRFHLFQFDAETTNLHLSVTTSHKVYVPCRQVANDVPRPVHALIFLFTCERVVYKHFCGLLGAVQVPSAHLWSTDPQFSRRTYRQSVPLGIYHIQAQVVQRLTYRNLFLFLVHSVNGGENRTLSRPVSIIE